MREAVGAITRCHPPSAAVMHGNARQLAACLPIDRTHCLVRRFHSRLRHPVTGLVGEKKGISPIFEAMNDE